MLAKPELSASVLANFREFASRQHVTLPSGEEADLLLQRELMEQIAQTKWGSAGRYRVVAILDPEVSLAAGTFSQAQAILSLAK